MPLGGRTAVLPCPALPCPSSVLSHRLRPGTSAALSAAPPVRTAALEFEGTGGGGPLVQRGALR